MSHTIWNGTEYPSRWGDVTIASRNRVELSDAKFAELLAAWNEGEAHGGIITSPWGEWVPDMKAHLEANPLDPKMLDVSGIGPKRVMRLYEIGIHDLYTLATADPLRVSDHLGISLEDAQDMVAHKPKHPPGSGDGGKE